MSRRTVDLDWRSVVVASALVIGLVAVVGLIRSAPRAVTAAVLAVLLVLALDPLVDRVQNGLRFRRGAAVAVVLAGLLVAVALITLLLVPPTVRQVSRFPSEIPRVAQQLGQLPVVGDDLRRAGVEQRVQQFLDDLPRYVVSGGLVRFGRSLADAVVAVAMTLLLTVALLLDGTRLVGLARRAVPQEHRETADRVGALAYDIIGRYAVASLVVAAITAAVFGVAGLALRVPLTPLAALWAGLWDLVPQVGGAVGGIAFVLLAFTRSPTTGIIATVVWGLYLQARNHFIAPFIGGRSVKLSPLATMAVVLIGVSAGGLLGGILSVPVAGVAKATYGELKPREN